MYKFPDSPFNIDDYTSDSLLVKEFQNLLKKAGYYPGTPNGIWDNNTETAFQLAAKSMNLNNGTTRMIGQGFLSGLTYKERKINQAGIDLIKKFEGLRLKSYYDSVNVLTIG